MPKRIYSSLSFENHPSLYSFASIAGQKEGEGPMKNYFDHIEQDGMFGEKNWEKAESRLQANTLNLALQKGRLKPVDVDCIIGGDLINQCTGSSFAVRETKIPFLGVYGACSTMAESLLLAGILVDGGYSFRTAAVTSSHFSTAERQFRFPLSYGGQRTPTAQWTCTASGAIVVSAEGEAPYIVGGCIGKINDLGVTDATNMGAAMAPAAADTILRYLQDTSTTPETYDAIITGDLGNIGSPLLIDLLLKQGVDISSVHQDCGALMFDEQKQDTHAGGSGCGCSASILCGYFLPKLQSGEMKKILFAATGALLSAMSSQQGESIPSICHLVEIRSQEGLTC
ncbi:MAG: stage V sporulation protein AD [Oscillospiraceae bacterium]|nr:stage V sporulation protein AD [Ruminococcus sp.]MDE6708277.1 stage V sporulation protein AD [Oscillospiraceae bacterium]